MNEMETPGGWRALAEAALKGAPLSSLDVALAPITGQDKTLPPLAPAAEPIYAGRAQTGPWTALQRFDQDGATAQALDDLENGATGLQLVFAGAPAAHGRGLTANSLNKLDAALDGVRLDLIALHADAGAAALPVLCLLLTLAQRRGTLPHTLHAGIDPIGTAAFSGGEPAMEGITEAVEMFETQGLTGTALAADGRIAAEAGASPADELAFTLSSLLGMLGTLDEGGIAPAKALPRIAIRLSANQDQFVTLAKLRAMRRLHAFVAQALDVPAQATLEVSTVARMLSHTDPHTNLLRLTLAAMAAAQGGADAIMVLPFDAEGSALSRRMARNIQSLMRDESHLAVHSDPGAGSGTIEALTKELAEAAWASAMAHPEGHHAQWLTDGRFSERVDQAAQREPVIIGVTKHPPAQPLKPTMPPAPIPPGGARGDGRLSTLMALAQNGEALDLGGPPKGRSGHALTPQRIAAPFER